MSSYQLFLISYSSVLIPFLTSLILFKKLEQKHYPFLYFIWLISAADLLSLICMLFFKKSAFWIIIINVNGLCESLLLTWILKKWGLFYKRTNVYTLLWVLFLSFWVIEVVFFQILFERHYASPFFTISLEHY
jgi:hypothetical protein